MKQLKGNTGFALDECVIAMVLICIVLLGMAMLICVSVADFMRSRKRQVARRANENSDSKPFPLQQRLGTELHGQDHPHGQLRRAGLRWGDTNTDSKYEESKTV